MAMDENDGDERPWSSTDFIQDLESRVLQGKQSAQLKVSQIVESARVTLPKHESSIQKLDCNFLAFLISKRGYAKYSLEGTTQKGGEFFKNSLTFIPASRQINWDVHESMDVINMFMPTELLQSAYDELTDGKIGIEKGPELFGVIDPVSEKIVDLIGQQLKFDWNPTSLYLDQLVGCLNWRLAKAQISMMGHDSKAYESRLSTGQARRAEDFLTTNFKKKLKLRDVAKEVGMSEFHFARSFKSTFGLSPHQFILSLRIRKATTLLESSSLNHSEIALESGFHTHSQFNKLMKIQTGRTPGKIRH